MSTGAWRQLAVFMALLLALDEGDPAIIEATLGVLDDEATAQGTTADVALVEGLYPLRNALETLYRKVDDSYFAAGSEAYAAALLVYQYAKLHNVASGALEESLDDLGRRFARKSRKSAPAA